MLGPRIGFSLALLVVFTIRLASAAAPNGPLPAPLVTLDNWWRVDVSTAPLDPSSAAFISFIGPTRGLHPDFGGEVTACEIYGFPYVTVNASQAKRAVAFDYSDESDGVDYATGQGFPFYPVPDEAATQCKWIEGGAPGNQGGGGDRHMLIYDTDNQHLYELYALHWDGARWTAGSGAFFDLKTNGRRPEGWTSADAAGLAILPGLLRHDEVNGPSEITHALRFTVRASNGFVYPASHRAGSTVGALPMGARLRLKAGRDISSFTPAVQKIFRAMKKYGLVVADNGSDMYISGVHDTRWDNGVLNPAFSALKASDFEVVQLGWQPAENVPRIQSFTATPSLVRRGDCSTLSWSAVGGGTVALAGASVSANDATLVCPSVATQYTLVATGPGGSASRSVTVQVNDGTAGLGVPVVTSPTGGQTVSVTGVGFSWTGVGGATGYDFRVFDGTTGVAVFSGSLAGSATSTLIGLPAGGYRFAVRACSGGFAASRCGGYGTVMFTVNPTGPSAAPAVTFPAHGATLTTSTQTLSWTAVTPNPALSGMTYEVVLRDIEAGSTALQISVPAPATSTTFTMASSTHYELKVRACQASCGPWSVPVSFSVTLPAVPADPPAVAGCAVSGGNSLTCSWGAVARADAYQVQVVQPPPAGPGGGALTVAAKQVSATTVTLPVPAGAATVFVAACNGDGCGPNGTHAITAAGPNPLQANIGTPMAGTVVSGPGVLLTWNRVPGDNGTNTWYRLYVQDLSRQSAALDVYTQGNFYGASFKAEGARYDALVISNPGLASQATGPAQGFNVSGSSATAPTMVSPAHNGTVGTGNIQLGWSPVPGSTLYEYYVAVLGQGSATVRGVTPGLLAQVPLTGSGGGTVYSGIVRACPAGASCASGSDAGWGPWSNAPGGPGVTNFTVTP